MTQITLNIVDDKDAEELLKALSEKIEIYWNNDTMVATMSTDVKNKVVTINKGCNAIQRLKL